MSPTRRISNPGDSHGSMGLPQGAKANDHLAGEQRVQSLSAPFRNILWVVFLIFAFAIVQMLTLWTVCSVGMRTAVSLERQGLPTLNELASLQEHLAVYRLNCYEYLFAREDQKRDIADAVETVAAQTHAELEKIKSLLPEGEGRRLASNLEEAIGDLDTEFRKVRKLVDSDFGAAMNAMDRDIPPRSDRVTAAANALKDYGYRFSGQQANATFGSFRWIKKNAIAFGAGNIVVAFGAVVFVLLAARRSRARLSETLARLDERTQELAGSLSLVHATLEATADGIVLIEATGRIGNFNQQFVRMWCIAEPLEIMLDAQRFWAFVLPLVEHSEKFAREIGELAAHPERESLGLLELKDQRSFETSSKPHRIRDRICGRVWSFRDITEQKRMQQEVEKTHGQLLLASRQAGMAEVATGVLHNVGNVLNSVNVSATVVTDKVRHTKTSGVAKVAALLDQHKADLAGFITQDFRGQKIPAYLGTLAESLATEQQAMLAELECLRSNIEHITDIVAVQQSYARTSGVIETVSVPELIEDALRINASSLARHDVETVRDFQARLGISTDKHKVMQILVNLVTNAKHACDESSRPDKRITVRTTTDGRSVQIAVIDNGIGIPEENLARIFNHGFTTRKHGHGFGLHSGALAAKELGGSLRVHSDGPGHGATFVLELPCSPPANSS